MKRIKKEPHQVQSLSLQVDLKFCLNHCHYNNKRAKENQFQNMAYDWKFFFVLLVYITRYFHLKFYIDKIRITINKKGNVRLRFLFKLQLK